MQTSRTPDGSAGDANYGKIGPGYTNYRQPEPRIAEQILAALGNAKSILNIGAGAGSYEPTDRQVTAVEPSAAMRAQRPAHLSQAIDAYAESLPFEGGQFEAAMGTFTVHQWKGLEAGLKELRRVTRGPILFLTCDPDRVEKFWLNVYAPLVLSTEARRYPSPAKIAEILGGHTEVQSVPIPFACLDGFNEAYYGRPEMLLDPGARQANSAWSFVDETTRETYVENLRTALSNGAWDAQFGHLRRQAECEGSLILIVNQPATHD